MKKKNFLIIGYGSSGKRFVKIIKSLKVYNKIYIYTKQKCPFTKIKNLNEINDINLDFVIICSKTHLHYAQLKFIDQTKKKLTILVEKPLFSKNIHYKPRNRKIFVGYNLRFDPMVQYLKNRIKRKEILFLMLNCFSYLPGWRKNINYKYSYSASKREGGGVTNDLSHEIDLASYLFNIKNINFAKKMTVSNLKIQSDDFSSMHASSNLKRPILINLCYFFHLNMRNIYIALKNSSFFLSFNERKIVEFSNNKKKTRYFLLKNRNLSYISMINSILHNKTKNCCSFKNGILLNKIISKYK